METCFMFQRESWRWERPTKSFHRWRRSYPFPHHAHSNVFAIIKTLRSIWPTFVVALATQLSQTHFNVAAFWLQLFFFFLPQGSSYAKHFSLRHSATKKSSKFTSELLPSLHFLFLAAAPFARTLKAITTNFSAPFECFNCLLTTQNTFSSLDGRDDFELAIEFSCRPITTVACFAQFWQDFCNENFPFQLSLLFSSPLSVWVKSWKSSERVRSAVGRRTTSWLEGDKALAQPHHTRKHSFASACFDFSCST